MTELRLSRLTPGDIDELTALERLGQAHPWREAWLSEALDDGHAECWGAHDGRGALVGHAILYRLPAEAWGSERMLLEVRGNNHGAQALYRAMGFVVDGRRANYYPTKTGQREDALLMSRVLK